MARLIVTRYENGQIIPYPGTDKAMQYKGTGWLIGNRYVITNHHVINARAESEPNATEADLKLQAENTCIQFDYDSEGLESVLAPFRVVGRLVGVECNAGIGFCCSETQRTLLAIAVAAGARRYFRTEQGCAAVTFIPTAIQSL